MKHNGMRLLGIGNAATDIVCAVASDSDIQALGLIKGQCVFLDDAAALTLSQRLQDRDVTLLPGGSAANVVSCYAALGGAAEFVGKTAQDECGRIFSRSMDDYNVTFRTPPVEGALHASTQIFTIVTPDGERSFAACYGASHHISLDDMDIETMTRSGMILLDGYMLMSDNGPEVLRHSVETAQRYGRDVVFLPADLSVIEARPDDVAYLMKESDAVICNQEQALALTNAADITAALDVLKDRHSFGSVTDGANGVYGFQDGNVQHVANPYQPTQIASTNGAGDNFAGGFLYGLSMHMPLAMACRLGMYCALECLKHQSPRPQSDLSFLLSSAA